jgi:hypothetical protein
MTALQRVAVHIIFTNNTIQYSEADLSEQMTTLQNHSAESGSRLSLPLAPLSLHQPVRNIY